MRPVCLVGSSEDGLRLRLRPSSVPSRAPPSPGGAFALRLIFACRHRLPMGRSSSSSTTAGEGRLRHQVVAVGVAKNQYKNRINCYAWVWGGPRAI